VSGDADKKTEELKREQAERARQEHELAESAELEHETAQHERRAQKSAYLRDKLAERERSERDARD
jgi:hypothetical protein